MINTNNTKRKTRTLLELAGVWLASSIIAGSLLYPFIGQINQSAGESYTQTAKETVGAAALAGLGVASIYGMNAAGRRREN